MGDQTRIEWTDATWNPIRGVAGRWHCTHVSEGCRNCYAERLNVRFGGPSYKPGADTFRLDDAILQQPLHWKRPRRVFVCSMTDLFHKDISDETIAAVFRVMARTPQHTFQVLTKRPERMWQWVSAWWVPAVLGHESFPGNVWLGVSVEDQQTAEERIPLLLQTPAAIRWVSYEPALGPLTLMHYLQPDPGHPATRVDWVVIGGESGPKARPFDLAWARSVITQCQAAGVSVFMKQVGSRPTGSGRPWFDRGMLNDPKGGDPTEWPSDLRVREWPNPLAELPAEHDPDDLLAFILEERQARRTTQ